MLFIQGRREDVEKAQVAVAKFLEEMPAQRARSRAGGRDLNIPPGEMHETLVQIPAQSVGFIIGPGGSTIKHIRYDFDVRADIQGEVRENLIRQNYFVCGERN